jgi:hypothetical protein
MNSPAISSTHWFARLGWLYRPVSPAGVVITLLSLAFCLNVFVAVDRHSHSVADTLYGIYPFFICTFLLWLWVAGQTTEN